MFIKFIGGIASEGVLSKLDAKNLFLEKTIF